MWQGHHPWSWNQPPKPTQQAPEQGIDLTSEDSSPSLEVAEPVPDPNPSGAILFPVRWKRPDPNSDSPKNWLWKPYQSSIHNFLQQRRNSAPALHLGEMAAQSFSQNGPPGELHEVGNGNREFSFVFVAVGF